MGYLSAIDFMEMMGNIMKFSMKNTEKLLLILEKNLMSF